MTYSTVELDNLQAGDDVGTDLIGGVHWQALKVAFGAEGAISHVESTATNPLPVALSDVDNLVLDNIQTAADAINAKDVMLGTDFSSVFGSSSLVLGTQADAVANTSDGVQVTAFGMVFNGTTWDRVREGGEAGSILVDLGANNDVTVTGTVTVDATGQGDVPVSNAGLTELAAAINTNRVDVNLAASAATVTVDATGQGDVPITLGGEAVVLGAGSASIGTLGANSGVDIGDVDVTSIAAGSNLVGDVGISGARTSGGTTLYRNIDVDETEDQIKGTAGQVYWIQATNLDATVVYLHFYNATAASVTVGTTTPDLTFAIPTQGDANGAGFVLAIPNGIAFSTAITIAATTTVGGSTGPAANEVLVNIGYA